MNGDLHKTIGKVLENDNAVVCLACWQGEPVYCDATPDGYPDGFTCEECQDVYDINGEAVLS